MAQDTTAEGHFRVSAIPQHFRLRVRIHCIVGQVSLRNVYSDLGTNKFIRTSVRLTASNLRNLLWLSAPDN